MLKNSAKASNSLKLHSKKVPKTESGNSTIKSQVEGVANGEAKTVSVKKQQKQTHQQQKKTKSILVLENRLCALTEQCQAFENQRQFSAQSIFEYFGES